MNSTNISSKSKAVFSSEATNNEFQFTNRWFDVARTVWDQIIPQVNPSRILEIGSFEGASTCYLIQKLAVNKPVEIHCVDTWAGGIEHQTGGIVETDMNAVESRFIHNIKIATNSVPNHVDIFKHKGFSDFQLSKILTSGKKNYFDFIYVDGSHQAPDVLCDAILSFRLLKVGGVMAFDDYLWSEDLAHGKDPIRSPKIAIDSFTNIYCRKLRIISAPLYQLYIEKVAD
jgi:predicted O-methyltransferase YrrM